MGLGNCRHCRSPGVATDAPTCLYCGGWCPNPGFFTRLNVVLFRLVSLAFLALAVFLTLAVVAQVNTRPDAGWGGLVYPGISAFTGAAMLLRSLIRPYGSPPSKG